MVVVPVKLLDLRMVGLHAVSEEPRPLRRDLDDLAVVGEYRAPRLAQERSDVRRQEVLAVAEADDERSLMADAGEQIGLIVVDRDDREMSLQLRVHPDEGLREIAVVLLLEQMDDDLGIGLRTERVPGFSQLLAKLAVVLDDAVEHDRELRRVAADEGMRILLGDCAMRRPARVAHAVARDGAVRAGGVDEMLQVADRADVVETVGFTKGDPGRVVPAILEPPQPVQEQRLRFPRTDISDDPAHSDRP